MFEIAVIAMCLADGLNDDSKCRGKVWHVEQVEKHRYESPAACREAASRGALRWAVHTGKLNQEDPYILLTSCRHVQDEEGRT